MSDPYAAAVSQAYDHTGLVVSQSDAYPPVSVPVDQHLHAGLIATSPPYPSSYSSTLALPPPHPSFYRQDSYATNSSGGTSSSSGSTLSSTPSDSLFYPPQASYETYPAPTPYVPTSTPSFVPATPTPAPPSASHLLQQHQANQQAFRLSQASSAPLVFGKYAAPAPGGAGAAAPDSPSSSTSDATATSSSQAGPSKSPISSHSNPSAGADGDFTQTFYDPFKVKHRRRTSAQQLKVLEHHFEINPKPDLATRKKLSEVLEMTPREVQVWFQNRRAKVKKLKERAEREAALSAATAAASATASSSSLSSADQAPSYQPLPPPPPPQHGSPQARTIYGSDVLAARRGSSPAMFSGLTAPSSASSLGLEGSFVPTPTSQPFLPLPPPPNGFTTASGASAYPSPVSLGVQSATPSPNDFLAHSGPTSQMAMAGYTVQGGYLDAVPSHSHSHGAGGAGGAGRRFSLPATHTSYALPHPSHPHSYAHDSTTASQAYYPSIPLRPTTAATATDPSVSPSSASSLSVEQGGWDQAGQVYAVDPHQQQSQLYAPPPPQAPQQASYALAPDAGSYAPPPQQPQAGWAEYSLSAAQVDGYGYSAQSTAAGRRGSMVAGMAVIAEHHQHQHAQQYHAEAVVGRPPSGGSGDA